MEIEKEFIVYSKVGELLSKYRSGKLPRALYVLPMLPNYKELLEVMLPARWTPAAVYEATKVFVNGKNEPLRFFLSEVLVPSLRNSIQRYKKLHPHLYEAVIKAIYKQQEFICGVVLPLCDMPSTTLKEAEIVSSAINKKRFPLLHTAAALVRLSEREYTSIVGCFINSFLRKKGQLPFQTLDALFVSFYLQKNNEEDLPVLWHQNLLLFTRFHTQTLSFEQKEMLLELIEKKKHHQITQEIESNLKI